MFLFFLHQDMLEQIATSEKVFDVSKANKVNTVHSLSMLGVKFILGLKCFKPV